MATAMHSWKGHFMFVLGWAIAVTALAMWWVLWRIVRYPGGWTYAFHQEHREARSALDDARGTVRGLRRTARREKWRARAAVQRAEWAYRRRVRRAEAELRQLDTTHRGARIEQLGAIALHKHAVVVGNNEIALAGLQVRFELGRSKSASYVYLTQPDGLEHMERYGGAQYPEDAVRRFVVRVQNAVAAADKLKEQRVGSLRAVKAELREARSATEQMEEAKERLEETRARHDADVRLPKARMALDDARSTWQSLTGRRPL
ncbi:hypothetical protein [Streptomyces aureus]|uniref:hypothetical protein n=1 Tax=Streptomyces aureus TaxID=193461 RepID=UPI000560268E|nr:hypothetical protein [Streptomyces aureus]